MDLYDDMFLQLLQGFNFHTEKRVRQNPPIELFSKVNISFCLFSFVPFLYFPFPLRFTQLPVILSDQKKRQPVILVLNFNSDLLCYLNFYRDILIPFFHTVSAFEFLAVLDI